MWKEIDHIQRAQRSKGRQRMFAFDAIRRERKAFPIADARPRTLVIVKGQHGHTHRIRGRRVFENEIPIDQAHQTFVKAAKTVVQRAAVHKSRERDDVALPQIHTIERQMQQSRRRLRTGHQRSAVRALAVRLVRECLHHPREKCRKPCVVRIEIGDELAAAFRQRQVACC